MAFAPSVRTRFGSTVAIQTDRFSTSLLTFPPSLPRNKFHLAFYGVGSPKRLLEHFCLTEISPTRPVVILNGFYPSLTLKDVLKAIAAKVVQAQYDAEEIHGSPDHMLSCLEVFFSRPGHSLVLLIHCVDELIRLHLSIWEAICNRLARGKANVHLIVSVDSHFSATAIPPHLPFVWYPLVTGAPFSQEMVFRAHASATSSSSVAKGLPKLDEESTLKALASLQQRAVLIFCFFAGLVTSRRVPISMDLLLEKVSSAEPDVNFKVLETFINQLQSHRLLKRSLKTQTIEPSLDDDVMQKALDTHTEAWILYSEDLL